MIIKFFALRLVCDKCDPEGVGDLFHRSTEASAFKAARAAGWSIMPAQGKATCPRCVKLRRDAVSKGMLLPAKKAGRQ